MRKLLLATTALLAVTASAHAEIVVRSGIFTSDHCTGGCGPQTGGFGSITATDLGTGTINIVIALNNGNTCVNGGHDVTFGFNLLNNPTLTYSDLDTT
jgi:hypothetical protein